MDEHVLRIAWPAQLLEKTAPVQSMPSFDDVYGAAHHIISAKRSARRTKNNVPK
jgi:hypothetical protein